MDGGNSWEGWELATGTYGATTPVLAVDPLEGPPIVWEEISGNFLLGTIYHSMMQEGSWQSEPLTSNNASYSPSLASDGSGRLHVAYFSDASPLLSVNDEVYYTTNAEPMILVTLDPPAEFEVPAGGSIDFTVSITNLTGNPLAGDLWLDAFLVGPGAELTIPEALLSIDNPTSGTIPPATTVDLDATLDIPSRAPTGLFNVIARVGNYATGNAIDQARFVGMIVP